MEEYTTNKRDKPSMKKCEKCGNYGQPNYDCKFWRYDAYTEWSCSSPSAIRKKEQKKKIKERNIMENKEKELTPHEALEILYDERAFAYDGKVHSKSNKNWSEDIKHYDRIGEALITLRNALEERDNLKHEIIDIKFQNCLYRQSYESKDKKIEELKKENEKLVKLYNDEKFIRLVLEEEKEELKNALILLYWLGIKEENFIKEMEEYKIKINGENYYFSTKEYELLIKVFNALNVRNAIDRTLDKGDDKNE